MNRQLALVLGALGLAAAPASAQISGQILVDPQGAQFQTIQSAVNAMFVSGISGPVDVLIAPGLYNESIIAPPIQGADVSAIRFIAFAGPGTVQLQGSGGDTFDFLAVSFRRFRGVVFDSLDFVSAPGFAIEASKFCEAFEIRNCTFAPAHQNNLPGEFRHALIVQDSDTNDIGWHVHHNHITFPAHTSRTSYGMYISNAGDWNIHDNEFDLNGCDNGIYLINNNRRIDRIYNNLFTGSLRSVSSTSASVVAAIAMNLSNYENDVTHNTFFVDIPQSGCIISTGGFLSGSTPIQNRINNNVFVLRSSGVCIAVGSTPLLSSNRNLFWAPTGSVGSVNNVSAATLALWQTASGVDANSVESDPIFTSSVPPLDLHPLPSSPVTDLGLPTFVTDDFDGRLRDPRPDAGAYELSGYALFGLGCIGTPGVRPEMGSSGTVQIGSANFAIELSQALGGTVALLAAGNSRTQTSGGIPLPFDLGGGCNVLVSPNFTLVAITSPGGTATQPFPLPNNPRFLGTNLYFQWLVADAAAANPFGLATSNGGILQL